MKTYDYAIKEIETAIDFYHSMDLGDGYEHWRYAWTYGYDILERVTGAEEHSLLEAHLKECDTCQEYNVTP